jgi:hypothetical protein
MGDALPLFPNGPERGNRPATIIKHETQGARVDSEINRLSPGPPLTLP